MAVGEPQVRENRRLLERDCLGFGWIMEIPRGSPIAKRAHGDGVVEKSRVETVYLSLLQRRFHDRCRVSFSFSDAAGFQETTEKSVGETPPHVGSPR